MHCVHKARGWQPKAAGGWFALLTADTFIIYLNDYLKEINDYFDFKAFKTIYSLAYS
jgi:hypothetical protein